MMHRAMTEPDRLLEEYRADLSNDGGILTESTSKLIQLMQSTNGKLVPKCISLCIISSSTPEIQHKLCKEGAWDILLKWLQEALKEDNYAFLLELLHVYLSLPVRLEQLTQNVCPKLINSLTKRCEHEAVRAVASDIVKKWKAVISADSKTVERVELKKKRTDVETKPEEPHVKDEEKPEKKRKRTVKMPPTIMRTAGVEDAAENHPKSRSEVFAKKNKLENETKPVFELPIESFHQKITVTPTEPRKTEIHESPDFINALTTTTCPVVRKKRKLQPVKSEPQAATEPQTKTEVPSESMELSESDVSAVASSPSPTPAGMGAKKSSLTSLASSFSVETKPKKRVSWADEDKLQSFYYFELDESERVNVNRVPAEEIRRKELSMERQLFRRGADDAGVGNQKWHTPLPLERLFLIEPGCKSVERQVQTERERYVLQAIYFTRESIPPSPEEPDPESIEQTPTLEIPLDDLTVQESSSVNSQFSSEKLLVVKDSMGNAQVSLNPEVADLVKSLAANLSAGPTLVSTPPSIAASLNSASVMRTLSPDTSATSVASAKSPLLTTPGNSEPSIPSSQSLQRELWDVLEENYPEVKVHELGAERIRDLLEPLRDQLIARGIFQLPSYESYPPPLPSSQRSPPPRSNINYPPHTGYSGPPPPLLPPGPRRDFRPNPRPNISIPAPFRPPIAPHFLPPGPPPPPPPPQYSCGPGPIRGGLNPPPPRGAPYMRGGGGRIKPTQPCRFFQEGFCRNGSSCTFLHAKR
ncbi:unnamed protein product [Calicophoron daubneyi]|uniref:Serine/threonine-protein phosphatase 1 regulatory subunit 10 n=1 Tax=Calicophoron daubneyi TaxID=300641 RepID=A0AAV2T126_CALDB